MAFEVLASSKFKREAKRLIKKYPSLKQELLVVVQILDENPETGTPLGNNTFKIRIAIKSKGKGKSGGARVISYCISEENEVYLLTIYDKSEFESLDDKTIRSIIQTL